MPAAGWYKILLEPAPNAQSHSMFPWQRGFQKEIQIYKWVRNDSIEKLSSWNWINENEGVARKEMEKEPNELSVYY